MVAQDRVIGITGRKTGHIWATLALILSWDFYVCRWKVAQSRQELDPAFRNLRCWEMQLKNKSTLYASLVGRGVAIFTLDEIANMLSIKQGLD
jgi:hypothetical protein